jgi:hypothetical protein
VVQSQPTQIVHETLSWKKKKQNPSQKRANRVAQVQRPVLQKKKKRKKEKGMSLLVTVLLPKFYF